MRVIWGQKGVHSIARGGSLVRQFQRPEGDIALPFAVRLVKFELEVHETPAPVVAGTGHRSRSCGRRRSWQAEFPLELNVQRDIVPADATPGSEPAYKVTLLRYLPDFVIDSGTGQPKSRSDKPAQSRRPSVDRPAAGSTQTQWVFARFPDFGSHGGADGQAAAMPLKFRFESSHATADHEPQWPHQGLQEHALSAGERGGGGDADRSRSIRRSRIAATRFTS